MWLLCCHYLPCLRIVCTISLSQTKLWSLEDSEYEAVDILFVNNFIVSLSRWFHVYTLSYSRIQNFEATSRKAYTFPTEQVPVLQHINFVVHPGEVVALVSSLISGRQSEYSNFILAARFHIYAWNF